MKWFIVLVLLVESLICFRMRLDRDSLAKIIGIGIEKAAKLLSEGSLVDFQSDMYGFNVGVVDKEKRLSLEAKEVEVEFLENNIVLVKVENVGVESNLALKVGKFGFNYELDCTCEVSNIRLEAVFTVDHYKKTLSSYFLPEIKASSVELDFKIDVTKSSLSSVLNQIKDPLLRKLKEKIQLFIKKELVKVINTVLKDSVKGVLPWVEVNNQTKILVSVEEKPRIEGNRLNFGFSCSNGLTNSSVFEKGKSFEWEGEVEEDLEVLVEDSDLECAINSFLSSNKQVFRVNKEMLEGIPIWMSTKGFESLFPGLFQKFGDKEINLTVSLIPFSRVNSKQGIIRLKQGIQLDFYVSAESSIKFASMTFNLEGELQFELKWGETEFKLENIEIQGFKAFSSSKVNSDFTVQLLKFALNNVSRLLSSNSLKMPKLSFLGFRVDNLSFREGHALASISAE